MVYAQNKGRRENKAQKIIRDAEIPADNKKKTVWRPDIVLTTRKEECYQKLSRSKIIMSNLFIIFA